MNIRLAPLLAAAALAGTPIPAFAGDDYLGDPPPLPEERWEEDWDDEDWDEQDWDEQDYAGHEGETGVSWQHGDGRGRDLPPQPYDRHAGYPPEQRAAWLEQCRQAYYVDDRGERRGEVIGGVLGGIGGAIIGNRILDGSRLGGTLIGGGVGALAGSAIGGEIGEGADRNRAEHRLDACEDYLVRYERGYAAPAYGHGGYPQAYGAYGAYGYGAWPPVMWVKVPIVTKRRATDCGCEEVVEEIVEEEIVRAAPQKRVQIRRVAPAPAKTKTTGKTVRYSK